MAPSTSARLQAPQALERYHQHLSTTHPQLLTRTPPRRNHQPAPSYTKTRTLSHHPPTRQPPHTASHTGPPPTINAPASTPAALHATKQSTSEHPSATNFNTDVSYTHIALRDPAHTTRTHPHSTPTHLKLIPLLKTLSPPVHYSTLSHPTTERKLYAGYNSIPTAPVFLVSTRTSTPPDWKST